MRAERETVKEILNNDIALNRAEQILVNPTLAGIDLVAELQAFAGSYRKLHTTLYKTITISDSYQQELKQLTSKLEETLLNFQKLKDVVLPICMVCHKIHTTDDYWERLEEYFGKHADVLFSHGICPDCIKVTYGKLGEQVLALQKDTASATGKQSCTGNAPAEQENESLREMRELLERAAFCDNPLTSDIEKIVKNHTKLLRRFDKIVSLSDSYQSQLRDFNLRLELMAHTDPLTGINNRGYFMELFSVEMERAKRYGRVFTVIILDVDNFKQVNDTRGHAAGDEVLRSLCHVMQDSGLRKCDFVGRIGGDEFVAALPETGIRDAVEVAERVRGALEKTAIIHNGSEFFISVSIGVSEYRAGDTRETLLQRADQAMYTAKESGRNKVCQA